MADKKVVLLMADAVDFAANAKFAKKAAVLAKADTAGLDALAASLGAVNSDAAGIAAALEGGAALVLVKGADIDAAMEAADRRTMLVVAGPSSVAFYGFAVNQKAGQVDRAVTAQDIAVTIANVADLEIDATYTGAIIYQAMKDPNMKLDEIKKLKEALKRLESVLNRGNQEPWDKHDCA